MLHDFEDRASEIDRLLAWLGAPADASTDPVEPALPPDVLTTLKASVLLLLYNLVEGTADACLQAIKDAILVTTETFDEFSREVQLLAIQNVRMTGSSGAWHERAVDAVLPGGALVRLAISERSKYFSGNLDLQSLVDVFGRFGVVLPHDVLQRVDSAFHTVYMKRNVLAHGDASFSKVGRDFTPKDLRGFADHILAGMRTVASEVSGFVLARSFLVAGKSA